MKLHFCKSARPDKDWLICYDYRSLEFGYHLASIFLKLPHCLVHGSMGSFSDNETISSLLPPKVSINGTLLYTWNESRSLLLFSMDICKVWTNNPLQSFIKTRCKVSTAGYKSQTVAQRSIEELKEELAAIQKQYLSLSPLDFAWQKPSERTTIPCRIANGWHGETKWILLSIQKLPTINKNFW